MLPVKNSGKNLWSLQSLQEKANPEFQNDCNPSYSGFAIDLSKSSNKRRIQMSTIDVTNDMKGNIDNKMNT